MPQELNYLRETASQTAGPYVHIGLTPTAAGFDIFERELGRDIAGPNAKGEPIRIEGLVLDGTGSPVKDALLEAWQANAEGIYAHSEHPGETEEGFRGWGRAATDFETGQWSFDTVKPGPVAGSSGTLMAPHINLWIVARGINVGLNTRLYFSDEESANDIDPILNLVEWKNRRQTLIAKRTQSNGKIIYRFDIRLQGDGETVFFDI
ncbi:MAG: protocatechuate 3,4-dioxygenase subunit alpha [Paracoccaceae bacterium]